MARRLSTFRNWAGTVDVQPAAFAAPSTLAELQDVVRGARGCVRIMGSAHSFNRAIDPGEGGTLLSLSRLRWVNEPCGATRTVRVGGGATYDDVVQRLHGTGLALANTAALPQVTVAGAVATGTHGSSGVDRATGRAKLGSLSSAVSALEFVLADGSELRLARGEDARFEGAVVSMGCLGAVSALTLDVGPDYDVEQVVYGAWPLDEGEHGVGDGGGQHWPACAIFESLDEVLASCDSFSAFVDWPHMRAGMLVLRSFVPPRSSGSSGSGGAGTGGGGGGGECERQLDTAALRQEWHGMPLRTAALPPLLDATGDARPLRATSVGRWHDVLLWFMEERRSFGPQAPEEVQFEFFVPLAQAADSLREVAAEAATWEPGLALYSELRVVAADELWLSPTTVRGGDSLAIAFGMDKHREAGALAAAAALERRLARFDARPHWGKLTSLSPADVESRFGDGLRRFRELRHELDPRRKFCNEWARRYVLGEV